MEKAIIERNKLIADFMGATYVSAYENVIPKNFPPDGVWADYSHPEGYRLNGGFKEANDLQYHTSWDWLMPVVEKINGICNKKSTELSNRSRDQELLENHLDNPLHWKSWSYHAIHLSTDIDIVYKKVNFFLIWYNTHK